MTQNIIWLRNECRVTERRTPLLPAGARKLMARGYKVIVEHSRKRIVSDEAYSRAGCRLVESGAWVNAPKEAVILGLKELPAKPDHLKNTHIYFAHAYKEQSGWQDLLGRFTSGGGTLLDIEYMLDRNGNRVVAFGFWAGYMGAALALIHWNNIQSGKRRYLDGGLQPFNDAGLLSKTIEETEASRKKPKVLIIGAGGRCGKGAMEILEKHGATVTCWGRDKTGNIERAALLDHDILINCAFIIGDVPVFLRREDLRQDTRLSVVADVSCDPYSAFNPIPLYHDTTTWEKPYITASGAGGNKNIDIIAIDNLPSLLPREASEEFAGLLLPHLMTLDNMERDPVWATAHTRFQTAIARMEQNQPGKISVAG
ncbi:Saccharopine dehydrogenase [NAD+, L-lysine-forming] [hydrothermal vent metagenome]|uniref:Saccharopine dehydrogenase [NAD(+), L-lysine-forming] n=1 Tax=hydrothermal vent metagenome TaxID=652676 RepID=A0A3B0T6P2_9ZZZZ